MTPGACGSVVRHQMCRCTPSFAPSSCARPIACANVYAVANDGCYIELVAAVVQLFASEQHAFSASVAGRELMKSMLGRDCSPNNRSMPLNCLGPSGSGTDACNESACAPARSGRAHREHERDGRVLVRGGRDRVDHGRAPVHEWLRILLHRVVQLRDELSELQTCRCRHALRHLQCSQRLQCAARQRCIGHSSTHFD